MMFNPSLKKMRFLWLLSGLIFLVLPCAYAAAQPVSSAQLIDNSQAYDGKNITYVGEAIGDIMVRGEHAWVNVNDGQYAIGVWMPKNLSANILYMGSYKAKGDWIEVSGVFHQVCSEHGGELDIHARSLKRIHSGYFIPHVFNRSRMEKAVILLAILGCVWILRYLIKT